jgi:hypothetical protein
MTIVREIKPDRVVVRHDLLQDRQTAPLSTACKHLAIVLKSNAPVAMAAWATARRRNPQPGHRHNAMSRGPNPGRAAESHANAEQKRTPHDLA